MREDLNCPKCKGSVVKSYGFETKMRSKLIKWNQDGVFAVCKSCNYEVPIGSEILKSIESRMSYEIDADKDIEFNKEYCVDAK
jgi:DNA-directed RNA polymerase subunit M/transcription elongation factor TFIIS